MRESDIQDAVSRGDVELLAARVRYLEASIAQVVSIAEEWGAPEDVSEQLWRWYSDYG